MNTLLQDIYRQQKGSRNQRLEACLDVLCTEPYAGSKQADRAYIYAFMLLALSYLCKLPRF